MPFCRPHSYRLMLVLAAVAWVGSTFSTAAGLPALRIEDAWIRWLPANLPAAGYVTLDNVGDKPVTLLAASSPAYADVSLHRSRNQGGSVSMVPVDSVTVEPHSKLSFATAGYHMMLMQPTKPLAPGDHVPVTLRFADGVVLTVNFEVRDGG
jgi:periplasmic copper chaperone A